MKYGALTIDTSIFDHYGLSLDTEPLKSLEQFKDKPVGLVLNDVVLRELLNHLNKKVEDQSKSISKAGRVAKSMNLDPSLIQAIERASKSIDAHQIATDKLKLFLESTGAKQLKSGDHVAVEELLVRYFDARPPFAASGQKKNEFPDAICLLALEAYARVNEMKILAVSGDEDWKDFSAQSEWIDFVDDLSAAIAHFHPQTSAYNFCHDFIGSWREGKYSDLMSDLESHVADEVEGFEFDVDANASLTWELNDLTVRLDSMDIYESGSPELDIRVINLDEDSVTFKIRAVLTCLLEADFGLSVYDSIDRDYTQLGSCSATTQSEVDAEIFIRISGDLAGPVLELELETVDVTPIGRLFADFGYIEPDWHEDDYD